METPNERPMRFVYARYRVAGPGAADVARKLPVILAELQSVRQKAGKYVWAMGDVGERTVESQKLLFGRLGKTAPEAAETDGDDAVHTFSRESIRGKKAAWSNFFIYPSNSIMVLEDKPLLPAAKFLKKFKQFWEASQPAEIDFDFLKNEPEIFATLNRWDRITAAKFELSSAGIRLREDFTPLDDLIKNSQARRAGFKFEGGGDGLATDSSIIQQGVSMAAAGYGEFSLKGVAKDAKTSLNSKSFLSASDLVEVDDLESLAPVILSGIRKILMQIGKPEGNSKSEAT
jgi:hypothetical protein